MPARVEEFGADLRLLDNLTRQNDRNRGRDLATIERPDRPAEANADLETLSGAENLQQALLLRFLTPAGELAVLGHPNYGSRLFELIGEPNIERTWNRAKLYVLEALAAEPRVQEVLAVQVTQNRARREQMDIALSLRTIESSTPLNLVFPFFLDGGTPL